MNVAVTAEPAAERDRNGADRPAVRGGRDGRAIHARGAGLEHARDRDVRALRLPLGRPAPQLLPRQRRGRTDHVAGRRQPSARRRSPERNLAHPRARDQLRRHLRGRHRRAPASSPASSPPRPTSTPSTAGSSPRSHRATTCSWSTRSSTRRWSRPGPASTSWTRSPSPAGPGLIGALLVGLSTAKALASARRAAADPGGPPARPRRRQLPRARPARAALPLPDRERRPHPAGRSRLSVPASRSWGRRSTTPPARPSTRARGCSASVTPAVRRSSARPRTATRTPSTSRSR